MSTRLYWREPAPPACLGNDNEKLKRIIARRYYEHDGSLHGEGLIIHSDDSTVTYLEGYLDALPTEGWGRNGILKFLADLRKFGRLEIWIDE